MLSLAQLRIDALLAVLVGTACAMLLLRAWLGVSKRAVLARDEAAIRAVEEARHLQGTGTGREETPP
jgi:hypothetical protein